MDTALLHLVDQIRAAAAAGTALRIRGGGSKDFYGQTLQSEILDTRAMKGIVSYEPSELVVTARAGTPLKELEAVLAAQGQHLAFEPPHFGDGATVGGMVAAGLSGPARAALGSVRDHVLGVEMVNGKAERLRFGGQVMKNVAGYDVSRLLAGSLGTLGLISEVSLKALPLPGARATLLFECEQADALRRLNAWSGQPLPVNASSWRMEQGKGRLCVRLCGAVAAVRAARKSMGGEPQDDAAAAAEWDALREQTLPFFVLHGEGCLWRLSVPDTSAELDLKLPKASVLLEWAGALRWVKAVDVSAAFLRAAASAVGGTATMFRSGAGVIARHPNVFHPLASPLDRIHRELKKRFDPAGIFNRGRMYADF